jgi:hypothetical protein
MIDDFERPEGDILTKAHGGLDAEDCGISTFNGIRNTGRRHSPTC